MSSFNDYEKFVELQHQKNIYRARFSLKLYGQNYPLATFLIHIPSTKDIKDCILIDCGDPPNVTKLLNALSSHFESFPEYKLKYVAITHSHYDHMGALNELLNNYEDIKIIMGEDEVPFALGKKKYTDVDGDNISFNILKHFPNEGVILNSEDSVVPIKKGKENEFEFHDVLRPVLTPGHTLGSLSYLHIPTNSILVGDLVYDMSLLPIFSTNHHISLPYGFTARMTECKESIKKVSNMEDEVKFVFPAHDLNENGISMEKFKKFAEKI